MSLVYQMKNCVCENTISIAGIIGTLCLMLTCNHVFSKIDKSCQFSPDIYIISETSSETMSDILSINISDEDFEIVSDHDNIDID